MSGFEFELLLDDEDAIEFTCGFLNAVDGEGRSFIQKDYRLRGEVWRVHKGDADPYPSNPHAHCVDGRRFYQGKKLHLGTGELYDRAHATGFRYPPRDFARLCEMIAPKFPGIALPLQ
jgi:hypothetical protein